MGGTKSGRRAVTQGEQTTKDRNVPQRGNPCPVLPLIFSSICLNTWGISEDGGASGCSKFLNKNHSGRLGKRRFIYGLCSDLPTL